MGQHVLKLRKGPATHLCLPFPGVNDKTMALQGDTKEAVDRRLRTAFEISSFAKYEDMITRWGIMYEKRKEERSNNDDCNIWLSSTEVTDDDLCSDLKLCDGLHNVWLLWFFAS
jgi:hypothetical protein